MDGVIFVVDASIRAPRPIMIPPSTTMPVKTIKTSYYVNGTLEQKIELYPCVSDSPKTDNSDIIAQWIRDRKSYIKEAEYVKLRLCSDVFDTNGLPRSDPFTSQYTRTASVYLNQDTAGLAQYQKTLSAVQLVLSTMASKFVDSVCINTGTTCQGMSSGQVGSLAFSVFTNVKTLQTCTVLKSDQLYGCNMFPGESTTMTKDASVYACKYTNDMAPYPTFQPNRTCMDDASAQPMRTRLGSNIGV
jgi:hypothetical protein